MRRSRAGRGARLVAAIALGAALAPPLGGCASDPPREDHRAVVVEARGRLEAYDALTQALVQRFESVDPAYTNREEGIVTTVWRESEEPDRLVRRRAIGTVIGRHKDDEARVEVKVERQLSTRRTDFGELDRQSPQWVGGSDVADTTLERDILLAVRQRLKGKVQ